MKIVGINLGILVGYTLFINLGVSLVTSSEYVEAAIFLMGLIGLHVITNLLISIGMFTRKDKASGGYFLLSGLTVLVIGFSLCVGSSVIYN